MKGIYVYSYSHHSYFISLIVQQSTVACISPLVAY